MELVSHTLHDDGEWHSVTDSEELNTHMLEVLSHGSLFEPRFPSPYYTVGFEHLPEMYQEGSLYGDLWEELGREAYYQRWNKRAAL